MAKKIKHEDNWDDEFDYEPDESEYEAAIRIMDQELFPHFFIPSDPVYSFPFDAKCKFKGRKISIEVLSIKYYKQFPNGEEAIFKVRRKMDGIVMNLWESKLKG